MSGRARASQLHPRQLNFNDDSLDSQRHQIVFEDVDANHDTNKLQHGERQQDDDDDQVSNDDNRDHGAEFEVVKIKFNNDRNDQKSQSTVKAERLSHSSKPNQSYMSGKWQRLRE